MGYSGLSYFGYTVTKNIHWCDLLTVPLTAMNVFSLYKQSDHYLSQMKAELNLISYSKPDSQNPRGTSHYMRCFVIKQLYKDYLIWLCFQQYVTNINLQENSILPKDVQYQLCPALTVLEKALTHQANLKVRLFRPFVLPEINSCYYL